jgi:hypothetical protein
LGGAFGNCQTYRRQQVDAAAIRARLEDVVSPGVRDLDDLDRDAAGGEMDE